jgi:WXG100 family type VII secretion target
MTEYSLSIDPAILIAAAKEFDLAESDLQAILEKLDTTTSSLKEQWDGAAQQEFYKQYTELRQYLSAFSVLLSQISLEMTAMAERYDKADH